MALYQPSYMSPRNSTIDTTKDDQLTFSCRLNGNSLLYGYDIKIYDASSNELKFQLTSAESKKMLQKQLQELQTEIAAETSQKATKERLMKEYVNDTIDDDFQDTLNENRRIGLQKIEQMKACINLASTMKTTSNTTIKSGVMLATTSDVDLSSGLSPVVADNSDTFFKLADEVIDLVNANSSLAKTMQQKIEGHYATILEKFQKRINNNSVQIQVNKDKYHNQKNANAKSLKTINQVKRILDYSTDNVSSSDSSTKRILAEYWKQIPIELQSQVKELTESINKKKKKADEWQNAINHLGNGMYVLPEPLYPSDYLGNSTVLSHELPRNVVYNGGNYKWKIILYWSSTNDKDNLDKSIESYESYFECRTMPTISISNYKKKIDKKYYEFQGEYKQKEHVPVNYFRWVLIQESNGEILKDTGYVPSPDIRFYYDGFMNEYKYTIQLFVRNQNGIEVQTEPMTFKAEYIGLFVDNLVTAQSAPEEHGILVSWAGIHGVTGQVFGDYTYVKDLPVVLHTSLELPKGSSLVFDKDNDDTMRIPATTTSHIISIRIDSPDIETLYEASGSNGGLPYYRRLTLEGNDLVYDINGVKKFRWTIKPDKMHWYVIFMLPNKLIVSEKWADGLFPSDKYNENLIGNGVFEEDENGLTPHVGLYPKALSYHNTEGEVLI